MPFTPSPGLTVSHYRLLDQAGKGGMGVVFRALDTRLEREVAIKFLPPEVFADPHARRRFRREGLALSRISHPNIQTVYEVDNQDDVDFLVTEFITGSALRNLCVSGPLPEKEVAQLGLQIAQGLAAVHQHGVVHRDLSGNNVLVTPDRRVKIVDFGLALVAMPPSDTRTTESLVETAGIAGTLPYLSPEQLRGEADGRSDIYAAGVLLYELATGYLPFDNLPAPALLATIQTAPPPPPTRLNPRLSPRMEEILIKCLEKEPERRYQTATELAVDLKRVIDPSPVARIRRHRLAGSLVLAAAVIAATLGGLRIIEWLGQRTRPAFANPRMSAIVTWPSEEVSARLSPDKQWVAFWSDHSGRPGLWRRHVSGGEPVEIVSEPGNITGYAWSPTGFEIAYLLLRDSQVNLKWVSSFGGRPGRSRRLDPRFANADLVRWIDSHIYLAIDGDGLWRLDVGTDSLNQVMSASSPQGIRTHVDVCPNEEKVAFVLQRAQRATVWTARLDGSRAERLTEDDRVEYAPRWASPDGRLLMVVSTRSGQPDIWCRNLSGGSLRQITFSSTEEMLDDVSLDGSILVFAQEKGSGSLWERRGKGNRDESRQLTMSTQMDLWPSVSGKLVAFQRTPAGRASFQEPYDGEIRLTEIQDRDPEESRPVTATGGLPTLSPRGDRLAFVRSSESKHGWELWLHDLERDVDSRQSEDFQRPSYYLAPLTVVHRNLAWSPDGRILYYVATEDGRNMIREVETGPDSTSNRLALAADPGVSLTDLAVSDDGARLAFVRSRDEGAPSPEIHVLWTASGADTVMFQLPDGTRDGLTLRGWLGPGDRLLAFRTRVNSDWTQNVEILEISPSGAVTRGQVEHAFACTARLDPAGKKLILVKADDRSVHNLYAFDLRTGGLSPLTDNRSPSTSFAGMEVLDDGILVYSQIEQNRDIWMIQFER